MTTLNERSVKALQGVRPELQNVAELAHEMATDAGLDFIITEGIRTMKRQRELFAAGATKTLNSRHLNGHAIDFAPVVFGDVTWKTQAFVPIIAIFKKAAAQLGVAIASGGDWKTFKDYPHIELDRRGFP